MTGINEVDQYNIAIYPNPADEMLYIDRGAYNGITEFSLMDINGRVIFTENLNGLKSIDISKLHNGIYFYQMKSDDFVKIGKVIIE